MICKRHTPALQSTAVLVLFFLLLSYISLENAASILSRKLQEQFAFSFWENERMKDEFARFFGLKRPETGKPLFMPPPILADYAEALVYKDIPYGKKKGQTLDILVPLSLRSDEKLPVFVFVHGGTWIGGSKDEVLYSHFAREVLKAGYLFVSLDYRVYPKVRFSGILGDIRQALLWLFAHIEEYGGRKRFVLCGHSAGAHLVALATVQHGVLPEDVLQSITQVFLLSGPYDLPAYDETLDIPFKNLIRQVFFDLFEGRNNLRELSPVFQVEHTHIVYVLVVGERDEITPREQSEKLVTKLLEKNNIAFLFVVPNAGHGGTLFVLNSDFDREGAFASIFRTLLERKPETSWYNRGEPWRGLTGTGTSYCHFLSSLPG
uniref:Alpha/beta hydrolase n=1 Tax=Candidatus Caldatribacterium californiense TaxID=1454726 RepID=A0A7V3YLY5_9BACT